MQSNQNTVIHVAILLALLFVLWYVSSWFFGCGAIPVPTGCDVFWGITRFNEGGKARVLIVYGDGGFGDHELLRQTFSNPSALVAPAQTQHISRLNTGNLKEYDLVIVEEARQLSSEDLRMFMDYVTAGGRLVWTGDAGTVLEPGDQLLLEYERPGGTDENRVSSPWARKIGSKVLAFDEFISVDYIANYCMVKRCVGTPRIGVLDAPNRNHELVKAITPGLPMYGDFAIVNIRSDSYSTTVLNVDALSTLLADRDVSVPGPELETPQCRDGKDNDFDGFIDYSGLDTDGDGTPEVEPDRGCASPQDDFEGGTVAPSEDETACSDGRDNDNDKKTDYPFDECCLSTFWDNESGCVISGTECSDGQDNDNDGATDFGNDPLFNDSGCFSASDQSEGGRELGRVFPIIVSSGVGQKVVYYSIPPEFFVSDKMPIDPQTGQRINYRSIVENVYYGMIR